MKKFLNQPEAFVDEMLEGILEAHSDQLKSVADDVRCIVRSDISKNGKVGLATGGGSGHLPLFLGYVGKGMLDGCSVGGVFQSPSSDRMLEVTKAIDTGKGVLYIYGNYGGDVMNFDMASEMAAMENIQVVSYAAGEDVASAPKGEEAKRRGVAGIFYVYKCAGAKAEEGANLDEVRRIAEKAGDAVRTMGVAISPVVVPEVGKPSFIIGDDEMEIGMGIHGEPGIRRGKLLSANDVVREMLDKLLPDLPYISGDEVSVLVNGLGATPKEELYVAYRKVAEILRRKGISVFKVYVGEFATSLEMAGFSISVFKLDDELKSLLAAPARTPFFEQFQLEV
ncbi:Putative dihydroxyacetone kinase, dihydroxyacetone binding subunit [Olavius algarvensis spirochete endosymbiont]|uniref:dihydroxyacetone kinase subunit DhaK n=1 Tax=Olavius algarvensis spirochete endosymbiont TaxID=260710 RepID=UPI00052CD909|nr:dihydroxyacetone kinase subunit DhaK [Olavius algarvensis spirochete endosymbiont]KGM42583.1 dihydroxyacetone kinase [Alkalispirochaeta odontotermitis]VDA99424.1 Putative dihydroxyacetone kinase, dihydroxyacetone binding subunit [Olavius algarvensis spirochete endosymbiont]